MKFLAIYRASFYLMLTFATLVLCIDASVDNPFSILFTPAVALAGLVAFLTVDRNPRLAPSRAVGNVMALASAGLSYAEYKQDPNLLLIAASHWLVYLQLIKMFLPKTVEDDWFLFLLGLVQVLVGGVMSQSDKVGIALFCWALMALWVLALFALHRESLRMEAGAVASPGEGGGGGGERPDWFGGLVDLPFVFSWARVAATTLALGGLIFLAMPRRSTMGTSQGGLGVGKHLTGFDDEVQLGQLGEILENDSAVMSIELFDREWRRVAPAEDVETRWRGVSLDRYERGRWRRPRTRLNGYSLSMGDRWTESNVIRQVIKLEPTDSPILFATRPILEADSPDKRSIPELNDGDGSLFRSDPRSVSYDYTVISASRPEIPQPGETYPSARYLELLNEMPEPLRDRLRPIALAHVGGLEEDDVQGRAAALESWLRESGEFRYSLQMDVSDPNLDPVEDFLVNRKVGHCEYFASALALLLRSIDVPTRLINGFKGGDYNAIAGVTTVRQKHAHSWVEALVGRKPATRGQDATPTWMVLDPSPADQRNESVARVGGMAGNFRQVTDFIRYVWIFYVVGFNADRQERSLYAPIRDLMDDAIYGFGVIGETIRAWLHFPSLESFFSLRGFAVSFATLLLLAGSARLAAWAVGRALRRFSGIKEEHATGSAGVQFYRRLLQLLAAHGIERPPAETPREFARRAAVFLSGHGPGSEPVADVPPLVVNAFYKIRYGDHTIGDDDFEHLNARLDALEARLHPARDGSIRAS